jgi:hypothetical protein
MTRYYYTNPVAAVWMAEQYGMRFASWCNIKNDWRKDTKGKLNEWDLNVIQCNIGSPIESIKRGLLYYTHPESMDILKPQVGDMVRGRINPNRAITVTSRPGHSRGKVHINTLAERVNHIIQRDGKPFHWPEVEA